MWLDDAGFFWISTCPSQPLARPQFCTCPLLTSDRCQASDRVLARAKRHISRYEFHRVFQNADFQCVQTSKPNLFPILRKIADPVASSHRAALPHCRMCDGHRRLCATKSWIIIAHIAPGICGHSMVPLVISIVDLVATSCWLRQEFCPRGALRSQRAKSQPQLLLSFWFGSENGSCLSLVRVLVVG